MGKIFKKYSLIGLSLLLVLSNFSYATQQMLCLMNDEDIKCECKCEVPSPSKTLVITDEDSPCCQRNTVELTNNNNLQSYNKELPSDITSYSPIITAGDFDSQSITASNQFSSQNEHVPKSEIPILISSLRI